MSKGGLIYLVILGHTFRNIVHGDNGFWRDLCVRLIYVFHMPRFMIISGYVAWRSVQQRSIARNLGIRIRQLIVPSIAWASRA